MNFNSFIAQFRAHKTNNRTFKVLKDSDLLMKCEFKNIKKLRLVKTVIEALNYS